MPSKRKSDSNLKFLPGAGYGVSSLLQFLGTLGFIGMGAVTACGGRAGAVVPP